MGVDPEPRPGAGQAPSGTAEPRPGAGDAPSSRGDATRGRVAAALGVRGRIAVGVLFFITYAISFALRGELVAGLLGGALGAVLIYLVFKEAEQRSRRRRG